MGDIPSSRVGIEGVAPPPDVSLSPPASGQAVLGVAPGEVGEVRQGTQGSAISIEDLNRLASVSNIAAGSSQNYSCVK